MLMNNLDPEVAERPMISSSTGQPPGCPKLDAFDAIVRGFAAWRNDETLLGPVGPSPSVSSARTSGRLGP